MRIKMIKSENEYKKALARINDIWDAKKGSREGDELEVLSILIEKYEEKKYPIFPPDPIDAIKFRMEQMGMEKKDLAKIIGANRVSEVLQRKRNLSLQMIKKINKYLNIPLENLL